MATAIFSLIFQTHMHTARERWKQPQDALKCCCCPFFRLFWWWWKTIACEEEKNCSCKFELKTHLRFSLNSHENCFELQEVVGWSYCSIIQSDAIGVENDKWRRTNEMDGNWKISLSWWWKFMKSESSFPRHFSHPSDEEFNSHDEIRKNFFHSQVAALQAICVW